jgi:tyrosyl-tRNA synthetase
MMLRWLQKTGHRPITLMGGGTTKVGDPTDKDQQRPLLSDAVIASNIAGIQKTFAKFLTFGDGPTDAVMLNNAEWLERFGYVEFLRDYGVHFSINRMLAFDSVKLRLEREQPMSFLEFNYMLMQATDFVELNRRLGCTLQMGGSDQWGNIINGVELIRRMESNQAFGLTTPLLTTASGEKMGKSVGGAVWLNADRLSPYDYWQMWRNTEDADVGKFLKLFTELPLDEIARLERLPGAEINEAKKVLANEATTLLHGAQAAETAATASKAAFEEGRLSDDLPTFEVARADLEAGIPLATIVADAGLASSRGEARRLAQGGGLRVNDKVEADGQRTLALADIGADGVIKLAAGKKKIVLIKPI